MFHRRRVLATVAAAICLALGGGAAPGHAMPADPYHTPAAIQQRIGDTPADFAQPSPPPKLGDTPSTTRVPAARRSTTRPPRSSSTDPSARSWGPVVALAAAMSADPANMVGPWPQRLGPLVERGKHGVDRRFRSLISVVLLRRDSGGRQFGVPAAPPLRPSRDRDRGVEHR
jgi:hypothetical protein